MLGGGGGGGRIFSQGRMQYVLPGAIIFHDLDIGSQGHATFHTHPFAPKTYHLATTEPTTALLNGESIPLS